VKNFVVYLQARIGSTRLPGKVLLDINGVPMIKRQIDRILESKEINGLVVLIPDSAENDSLALVLKKFGVEIFRGSEDDVLQRFVDASKTFMSHNIIRITADCPLIMPDILDDMVRVFSEKNPDYLSNTLIETYPDGLDIEIFSTASLRKLLSLNLGVLEREHVTLGIYTRPHMFTLENFKSAIDLSRQRWTVDYPDDFEFVKGVFEHYRGMENNFRVPDVLNYIELNPSLNSNKSSPDLRHISLNIHHKEEPGLQRGDES